MGQDIPVSPDPFLLPDSTIAAVTGPTASASPSAETGVIVPEGSQMWYMEWMGQDRFAIRQHSTGLALGAFEDESHSHQAVMVHPLQNNKSQVWHFSLVAPRCVPLAVICPKTFECGSLPAGCDNEVLCGPHAGSCTGFNALTREADVCNVDHICQCFPKSVCSACGVVEDDGCGGQMTCPCSASPAGAPGAAAMTPVPIFTPQGVRAPAPAAAIVGGPPAAAQVAGGSPATATPATAETPPSVGGAPSAAQTPAAGASSSSGAAASGGGSSSGAPASAAAVPAPAPMCIPRMECDEGLECGTMPDGCGGEIACGSHVGMCVEAPKLVCSPEQVCVCEPTGCENRCGAGPFDDGCGNEIPCECTMSNEICDMEAQTCAHIPQPPPPPGVFADPAPGSEAAAEAEEAQAAEEAAPTEEDSEQAVEDQAEEEQEEASEAEEEAAADAGGAEDAVAAEDAVEAATEEAATKGGATAEAAVVTAAPVAAVAPVVVPAPAAPISPELASAAQDLTPDMYKFYTFFYYFYYYYHWLQLRNTGVPKLQAAQQSSVWANEHAVEQFGHLYRARMEATSAPQSVAPAPAPALVPFGIAHAPGAALGTAPGAAWWMHPQAPAAPPFQPAAPAATSAAAATAAQEKQALGRQLMEGLLEQHGLSLDDVFGEGASLLQVPLDEEDIDTPPLPTTTFAPLQRAARMRGAERQHLASRALGAAFKRLGGDAGLRLVGRAAHGDGRALDFLARTATRLQQGVSATFSARPKSE